MVFVTAAMAALIVLPLVHRYRLNAAAARAAAATATPLPADRRPRARLRRLRGLLRLWPAFQARLASFLGDWVLSTNHRRIAVLYFVFVGLAGFAGLTLATIIRLELAHPGQFFLTNNAERYLTLISLHGIIMVFFMIIPVLFGAFGNFLLPTQLGIRDVAFPRLNSFMFWVTPAGFVLLMHLILFDRPYNATYWLNHSELRAQLRRRFTAPAAEVVRFHEDLAPSVLAWRLYASEGVPSTRSALLHEAAPRLNRPTVERLQQRGATPASRELALPHHPITARPRAQLSPADLIPMNDLRAIVDGLVETVRLWMQGGLDRSLYETLQLRLAFVPALHQMWREALTAKLRIWLADLPLLLLSPSHVALRAARRLSIAPYLPEIRYGSGLRGLDPAAYLISSVDFAGWALRLRAAWLSSRAAEVLDPAKPGLGPLRATPFAPDRAAVAADWMTEVFSCLRAYAPLHGSGAAHSSLSMAAWAPRNPAPTPVVWSPLSSSAQTAPAGSTWAALLYEEPSHNGGTAYQPTLAATISPAAAFARLQRSWGWFQPDLTGHTWPWSWVDVRGGATATAALADPFVGLRRHEPVRAYNLLAADTRERSRALWRHDYLNDWRRLRLEREVWRSLDLLGLARQHMLFRKKYYSGFFDPTSLASKVSIWLPNQLIPGWAFITPYASRLRYTALGKVDIALIVVFAASLGSVFSAVNYIITYRYIGAPILKNRRELRSFFVDALLVGSRMILLANPALLIGILLLLSDRHFNTSVFDFSGGGDTILFQHLFWFFGHPEVYIIIIPCFGFMNSLLPYYLRKRLSGRLSLQFSMYTIAFMGFAVWGHHLYMVGLANSVRTLYSTMTVMISVPASTKVLHWCVTLVQSTLSCDVGFLFLLSFMYFFVLGGLSGMFVAHIGFDTIFHDTFYVIGHFHVMLAGAAMCCVFAAFYFYFPAIFGIRYSRVFAYLHYAFYMMGQLLTLIPMFWLGYSGMPRRIMDYPSAFGGWHSLISSGHLLTVLSFVFFLAMLIDSFLEHRAPVSRTKGVSRLNTRLAFYAYEVRKLEHYRAKSLPLVRGLPARAARRADLYQFCWRAELPNFEYVFTRADAATPKPGAGRGR